MEESNSELLKIFDELFKAHAEVESSLSSSGCVVQNYLFMKEHQKVADLIFKIKKNNAQLEASKI